MCGWHVAGLLQVTVTRRQFYLLFRATQAYTGGCNQSIDAVVAEFNISMKVEDMKSATSSPTSPTGPQSPAF